MGQPLIKLATNWPLFTSNKSNEKSGYLLDSFKSDFKVILSDLESKINQFGQNVSHYRMFSIFSLTVIGLALLLLTLFLTLTRKNMAKLNNYTASNHHQHSHQNTRFSFRGFKSEPPRGHFQDQEKGGNQSPSVPFGQTY